MMTNGSLRIFPIAQHYRRGFLPLSQGCRANIVQITDNSNASTTGQWEYPIYASDRVRERKSTFVAHATNLPTPSALGQFLDHLTSLPALKRATHCMYAWRIVPDPSRPSSHKLLGQNDGGEKGSGERLSRLLEAMDCENVIVVVSRWYGGVPLGSDRWRIISSVAKEALHQGNFVKEKPVDTSSTNKKRKKK
ncbi:ribosomal protein S5 domain 2-type protein [Gymnopilus junonius]|uniref:Ribosomal protein S5 domain 2-type protein n=1 Tax=Gymnopilus junonius TaxID=109634 RepID=A0A9P5NN60_GYMJU|nr:ribosomal protein S5 domain 2-type protein [Gymnopilus junonius]